MMYERARGELVAPMIDSRVEKFAVYDSEKSQV
jgi:hypothetical protein